MIWQCPKIVQCKKQSILKIESLIIDLFLEPKPDLFQPYLYPCFWQVFFAPITVQRLCKLPGAVASFFSFLGIYGQIAVDFVASSFACEVIWMNWKMPFFAAAMNKGMQNMREGSYRGVIQCDCEIGWKLSERENFTFYQCEVKVYWL